MFRVESKSITTITVTSEQRVEMQNKLEKAIESLESFVMQQHSGMTSMRTICPATAQYIMAKALVDSLNDMEYSIVPLLERVIFFTAAVEKAPNTMLNRANHP